MNYQLTQHAKDMLAKRRIPLTWVEHVLEHPERIQADRIDGDLEHRLARIPEYANRVLRVIVNRESNPQKIVTFYFDRVVRDRL